MLTERDRDRLLLNMATLLVHITEDLGLHRKKAHYLLAPLAEINKLVVTWGGRDLHR